MTVIKAAAVQLSPVLYSREGTVDKVIKTILELGSKGVQFATFPETIVPYYPYFSFVQRPYESGAERHRLLEQRNFLLLFLKPLTLDSEGQSTRKAGLNQSLVTPSSSVGRVSSVQCDLAIDDSRRSRLP